MNELIPVPGTGIHSPAQTMIRYAKCCGTCEHQEWLYRCMNRCGCRLKVEGANIFKVCDDYKAASWTKSGRSNNHQITIK